MELKSGTYLQGDKYRIERSLGQGGFGITYLAEHELAGRMVCIKEFFPKSFYNRDADSSHVSLGSQGSAEMMDAYKQKFLKEARTIARLDHQNIIHIHDVFQENGTAYYVMEYIEGESLQDIVRRRGALPTDEALALMNPVIDAVGYIHDRRIMHLDIKPGNIMVRKEDGRPILIDFGLSKQYDEEGNQTSSTPVGISHGFAPIEQYQMGGVSAFSPQTDIYSLGATLYYLVSGTVPPQAAIVANDGMPELPATISANVRTAIEKSMQFVGRNRPDSIAKLKQLLGVTTSAHSSDDTAINTPADDNTTQIDVANDDATQIDGGCETDIEPKAAFQPKATPRQQRDVKITEPRIEARHIPRIAMVADAVDSHFAKVLESGIESELNGKRVVYTTIYVDGKKIFTITSSSNRIGVYVVGGGSDKVSKRILHLRNSNPNYIYTPGRENIIGNNSEKLIDVICEVMDGVNADIKYYTHVGYTKEINKKINWIALGIYSAIIIALFFIVYDIFSYGYYMYNSGYERHGYVTHTNWTWVWPVWIISIAIVTPLCIMAYNKVINGRFSMKVGAPKK